MTVFLIIALVVLTLLSILFAFMAGYGAALKDRSEKSKEALKALLELAKGFSEYMNSHEGDPEHPESTQEPEPEKEEAAEK